MNLAQPWNLAFAAGFVAYVAIRGIFQQRAAGKEIMVRRLDGSERALLTLVGIGALLLPLLYLLTPWLGFADYHLPAFASWGGAAAMPAALWFFYRSHVDLGRNWSATLELREGHELVTSGVYRLVRHPMYAAILLWDVAQGLLLRNWLAGWTALVTFALLYIVRSPREERMMREFFGDQYRAYMARTGAIFPRL